MGANGALGRHSLSSIMRSYYGSKFQEELRTEWAIALFYRPVSLFVLWLIQDAPVTPLALTLGNFALALLLPVIAIYVGPATALPILVVLAIVYGVVDCLDGGLARLRRQTSKLGQYLDSGSDQLYRLSFYLSVGLVISRQAAILCILAAFLASFAKFCRLYVELRFPSGTDSSAAINKANVIVSLFSGFEWAMPFAALLLWWNGGLWIFTPLVLIFSLLDFANTQWALISRLARD